MNRITLRAATSVQRQLAVVVGVSSIWFLLTARTVWQFLVAAGADGRLVNVAGRQRMLTQRIAREALASTLGAADAPDRLGRAADEFDAGLHDLAHGSVTRGLPPAPVGARDRLDAVAARWPSVANGAGVLRTGTASATEQDDALREILAHADELLRETDQVVAYFDEEYSRKVRQLRQRLSVIGVGGALVLAATYLVLLAGARHRAERAEAVVRLKEHELQELAEERQALVRRLMHVTEEERRRVAFDMHDGPAQQLAGAAMLLEAAVHDAPGAEDRLRRVETARSYLDSALEETRRIIADLRPPLLDDLGVAEALHRALESAAREAGVTLQIQSSLDSMPVRTPQDVEVALYRVAHEAVTNALKHSGARSVTVILAPCDGGVVLQVRDSGRGFDPTASAEGDGHRPLGLPGMRERVEALGGRFNIETGPGSGVIIEARLPAGTADDDR